MMSKIDYSKLPIWTQKPRPSAAELLEQVPVEPEDTIKDSSPANGGKPSLLKLPQAVQEVSNGVKSLSSLMQQEHQIINDNLHTLLEEIRSTTGYKAKILGLEQKIAEMEVLAGNKDELINDLKTEVALRNESMSKTIDALTAFNVEAAYLDLIRTMRDGVQVDINSKKKALEGVLAEVALLLKQPL